MMNSGLGLLQVTAPWLCVAVTASVYLLDIAASLLQRCKMWTDAFHTNAHIPRRDTVGRAGASG